MRFAVLLAVAGVASTYTVTTASRFMEKNFDPIVIPGKYESHLHTFFGSDAVTPTTNTSKELQAGCSTAQNPNDYSSYCEQRPFRCLQTCINSTRGSQLGCEERQR